MEETTLYEANPSMFRNRPIWFIINIFLIAFFGLGLVILFFWWLKAKGTTITVTNERITLRTGILSKNTTEVYLSDVRNVQMKQGFLQRMFSVGSIGISSAGTGGIEISIHGIKSPEKIKEIVDQYRRDNK